MANFTGLNYQMAIGASDASPSFAGNAFNTAGCEIRLAPVYGATSSTPSASWPYMGRPILGTAVVPQMWMFTTDTTGNQINTYDGTSSHYNQVRFNWDNTGTYASAPAFTFFGDSTLTTPVPGNQGQQASISGSPIVNGQATDTASTSYIKINAYGFGLTSGGTQQTPAQSPDTQGATPVAPTVGTTISTTTSGVWLSTWTSGQGWLSYIQNGAIPQAVTSGFWYWLISVYVGANMTSGAMLPVLVYQYAYT